MQGISSDGGGGQEHQCVLWEQERGEVFCLSRSTINLSKDYLQNG